jgi:2-polyprenyl-3-methyl-5-hydroxy-6-metoxy-1,4-benzoquinol methylase
MNNITENTICLACGSEHLIPSLNLGNQPLANDLKSKPIQQDTYPLGVNLCTNCYHLQLTHTVDPKIIYSNYLYVAGTSKTLKEYSEWFAGYVVETMDRQTGNILDIGCNDGTQLDFFKPYSLNTFGIDPAENIHPTSSAKHDVICDYFGPHIVDKIHYNFDAITAQNVFAHNPKPLEFLQTVKKLMSEHTLVFIQTSQADMVLNNEFDTIYHEHISFYNIKSMLLLCNRAGLNLIDVIKTPIHGTSYIFVISADTSAPANIKNLIEMEISAGLYDATTYIKYTQNCIEMVDKFKEKVEYWRSQGYKVVGYGAAAKASTFLNFSKVSFDIIIDDNPLKQGLYTPGSSVGIVGSDALNTFTKDDKILFVPLAWNFFKEIRERIITKRNNFNDVFLNMKDL